MTTNLLGHMESSVWEKAIKVVHFRAAFQSKKRELAFSDKGTDFSFRVWRVDSPNCRAAAAGYSNGTVHVQRTVLKAVSDFFS
jgi:hypothetical protein